MTKRVSKKMREELSIHQTFRMYDDSGKENAIRFIAAHKGGIQMFSNPGELVAWAKTPEMIAYALRTKGADDIIMGSSSMDFASEEGFDFVYEGIKSDIHLSSISGGTDLMACFVLGCPVLPVYAGEI